MPNRPAVPILLAALALLLLTSAMPVQAGNQHQPEITDRNDDVSTNGGCPTPWATPPVPDFAWCPGWDFLFSSMDINSAWANETASDLTFTIEMKANTSFQPGLYPFVVPPGTQGTGDSFEYDYSFNFTVGTTAHAATAHIAKDGTLTPGGDATQATVVNGNQLVLSVPKAALPDLQQGDLLQHLRCYAYGIDTADGDVTLEDHAPDDVDGLDYLVKEAAGAAPAVVYANATGPSFAFGHDWANATTQAYLWNLTDGPASAHLVYSAAGTGNVTVTVLDAAGATVYTHEGPGADEVDRAAAAGTWTVRVAYDGFVGKASLTIAPSQVTTTTTSATPTTTTSTTSHDTTGPTDEPTSETESEGSPSLALPLLIGAVAVAVLLRRKAE